MLLAAAAAATAQAPAAKPGPAAIDGWGRAIDLDAKVRSEVAEQVIAVMGSPDWVPVAFQLLEMHAEILPRLHAGAILDLQCGKRYRREHPESTADQYPVYVHTAEGQAWARACIAELLKDPSLDPAQADGAQAGIEAGYVLPQLLQGVRLKRQRLGLEGRPDLAFDVERKIPVLTRQAFENAGCLLREALKTVPLSRALTDLDLLVPPLEAVVKSGVCAIPKPKGKST